MDLVKGLEDIFYGLMESRKNIYNVTLVEVFAKIGAEANNVGLDAVIEALNGAKKQLIDNKAPNYSMKETYISDLELRLKEQYAPKE